MAADPPKVFISYSHDTAEHTRRVRALADRLRVDGIEAWIDQYVQDPDEGWIRWMRQKVKQADKVLLAFTEAYQRRFEGDEIKGQGLGATFEGVIVTQALYESGGRNAKFRPAVFEVADERFISDELRQFNHYRVDTPEGYEKLLRWLHGQGEIPPPIGPKPPGRPMDAAEKGQLGLLRRRVEWAWVKEVLEKSLFDQALVELGMESRADALDQPWERVVELSDHTRRPLPPQTRVWDVYQECGNALLILGEPGSGKTTTLLELARSLVAAAEANAYEPVPVVLNLSTWANKRLPLARWAAEELRARYQVPLAKGRQWLAQGRLILLLDGLDEVPEPHRAACLQAVKAYLPLPGLVVCSRLEEYLALPARLNLSAAVCLQPLSHEQVDEWLTRAGLTSLQEVIRKNAGWRELLKTPLMLSVACLAFAGSGADLLAADTRLLQSLEESRAALFERYIDRMFVHRARGGQPWSRETILRWLGWLARSTLERSQTALLVENLQPNLLPGRWRWAYVVASRLLVVLVCVAAYNPIPNLYLARVLTFTLLFGTAIIVFDGLALCNLMPVPKSVLTKKSLSLVTQFGGFLTLLLVFCVPLKHYFDLAPTETVSILGRSLNLGLRGTPTLLGMASSGLICWIVVGMGAGLRLADSDIQPLAGIAWSVKKALKWALIASVLGCVILFIWALAVFGWSYNEAPPNVTVIGGQNVSRAALVIGEAIFGALLGCVSGFAFGGWTPRLLGKVALSPNQGVHSSLVFSLRMGLMSLGLCAPAWILSSGFGIELMGQVVPLLVLGFGGQDVIRHGVLRVLLAYRNYAPLNYVRFLNHAVDLALLQRSGGAYLFIHRTFQEHLAAMQFSGLR
jgi:eukaryotic-like serine/threonine-protein kinase